ncbi:uncharacterized protein LOC107797230 [Nicotiana tabacum]|uniref:Uncharacterized protein LOC107797230 n=1 Tax=Nicotiana tabacum TaxID=4097 RepID=A0A1S4AG07_TOBAC|nr:PREDICTED: uncharacterized protein LOC107797230 [Nicotiana tabacum]
MSTRRDYRGYEELIKEEEPSAPILGKPKLSRNGTVPAAAKFFSSSSKKVTSEENFRATTQLKEAKKASKIHPIFSLFETKKKKKATARPEFSRYIQYVRDGGFGDVLQTTSSKSNMEAVK